MKPTRNAACFRSPPSFKGYLSHWRCLNFWLSCFNEMKPLGAEARWPDVSYLHASWASQLRVLVVSGSLCAPPRAREAASLGVSPGSQTPSVGTIPPSFSPSSRVRCPSSFPSAFLPTRPWLTWGPTGAQWMLLRQRPRWLWGRGTHTESQETDPCPSGPAAS